MTESENNKNKSEEVDLIVLSKLIGRTFNKFFQFIASVFKFLFSIFILFVKLIIINWKLILSVVLVSFIVGNFLETRTPRFYQSEMIVKPYFESKYQLIENIDYFNALIEIHDYNQLDKIFNIDSLKKIDVSDLVSFNIKLGPETESEKMEQFLKFAKNLDSFVVKKENYEQFIENRINISGEVFVITAKTLNKNIFKNIESGIKSSFINDYSKSKRLKDSLLYIIKKKSIEKSIVQIEKLQDIYIKVLENQSESARPVSANEFLITKENELNTKEFELFEKQLELENTLTNLEEKRIIKDAFVDNISSFQLVKKPDKIFKEMYSLTLPLISLGFLGLLYILSQLVIYAKNYGE